MKKILSTITSVLLCITMLVLSPAQVIASAESKGKYISEVKVGMGETAEEASKELLAEGYTIFSDDKGSYADLNEDAGTSNVNKEGPNQKIVYLGYKTTNDINDAVTDLAVMKMNGAFSYQAYEELMQEQMDTKIKPFVDRFIATLEEYRENLDKPKDSANYKRADYYRTLLNKLTDDDTGSKPLGDLLTNKTKYEMGDDAYNALSDEEKKEHCDILTLLMQGNGQAVHLMEVQLTKASDASDNTWLDRFLKKDLDALTEEVKEENPGFTPSEINQELDKKYYDDAKKLRDKWSAFREILINYDNAIDSAEDVIDADTDGQTDIQVNAKSSDEVVADAMDGVLEKQELLLDGGKAAEDIVVSDFLEATEYDKGTLLDFFKKNVAEFNSEKKIRQLYPIVDALSGGQLAGLDFLSIKDMIIMAFTDDKGFKDVSLDDMAPASIYEGVNREIYEKGGVALTNKLLREQAAGQNPNSEFKLSALSIVLWTCTTATGLAAAGSGIASVVYAKKTPEAVTRLTSLRNQLRHVYSDMNWTATTEYSNRFGEKAAADSLKKLEAKIPKLKADIAKAKDMASKASQDLLAKSNLCKYLAAGFTVAMALLAAFSIYTTIAEMKAYYRVEFAPIPKYIVEEADITDTKTVNGKKETTMVKNETAYYKAVTCNRTDGGSDIEKKNHEILMDRNDLNGDVGKQWLALYSVKYDKGFPILADSLKLKLGEGGAPEGYETGIHMFGEAAAQNLTDSKELCYNDPHDGTYVYFKHDSIPVNGQTAAGSLFSGGSIAIGVVIGLAAGCVITFVIMKNAGKKKKEKAESNN